MPKVSYKIRDDFDQVVRLLARAGALRVSELAIWFEHPRSTVAAWTLGTRSPGGTIWSDVWARAQLLDKAIYKYRLFPIPRDVHFSQRKRYVKQCLADAHKPVPKGIAARDRIEMRIGTRPRRIKAPTVGVVG